MKMNAAAVDEEVRIQRRRASAAKRMVSRQNPGLDECDLEGLSMPALTKLKARSESRNGKFKKRGYAMAQPRKEQTKVCLQKIRHTERVRANRARMDVQMNDKGYGFGCEAALA